LAIPLASARSWRYALGSPVTPLPRPSLFLADPAALAGLAHELGLVAPIAEIAPSEGAAAFSRALPVVPIAARADATPGAPSPAFAAATIESIERAVRR